MTSAARFDLMMAAEEKAQVLLQREARVMLSERDFSAFARALNSAFAPNPALKSALKQARRKVRRA
jgi:uncharacterized protein (DUF1778 family)